MRGAIAACREAIRLKPDLADAHTILALALRESGDVRGAIAACREAIRLKPDDADAHYNLGNALRGSGDVRGAIAAYHEAIRLKPDYAEAHCNLGHALRGQGRYAESLAELRVGHELGSKRHDWHYPSAAWVAQAERLAARADRLPAVLAGTARPADAAERLAFAQMAYDTKRYAAAARLWSDALAADPKLGEDRQAGHRYDAACAAALAAAGRGEGEPPPDAAAKVELRRKALDWLRAELSAWSKVLDSADPKARAAVAPTLRHWKEDSDLTGVRDGDAIATLPADERRAWEALWKDVDALLKGEALDRIHGRPTSSHRRSRPRPSRCSAGRSRATGHEGPRGQDPPARQAPFHRPRRAGGPALRGMGQEGQGCRSGVKMSGGAAAHFNYRRDTLKSSVEGAAVGLVDLVRVSAVFLNPSLTVDLHRIQWERRMIGHSRFVGEQIMAFQGGLETGEIATIFTEEVAALGGNVPNTFDDGRRLFMRAVLPAALEVQPRDRVQGGVALARPRTACGFILMSSARCARTARSRLMRSNPDTSTAPTSPLIPWLSWPTQCETRSDPALRRRPSRMQLRPCGRRFNRRSTSH